MEDKNLGQLGEERDKVEESEVNGEESHDLNSKEKEPKL